MAYPLPSRISDGPPATTGKLYWHVPRLAWNARVRSGDLVYRGARRQHGARVRRARGMRQLFGESHLARLFPWLPWHLRFVPFSTLSHKGHAPPRPRLYPVDARYSVPGAQRPIPGEPRLESRRDTRFAKILTLEQERLARNFGDGLGKAIARGQSGRLAGPSGIRPSLTR